MEYCLQCMKPLADGRCPDGCVPPREPDPHILPPGTLLNGRYLIGRTLGQGGFGITYIGRDQLLDIRVAIKEYYPSGFVTRNATVSQAVVATAQDKRDLLSQESEKFLAEARLLARFIGEPGIVDVRDYFRANNTAYIVMEYLDGETLRDYIRRRNRLSPQETFALLEPVMRSLDKVHQAGLIHRDVSPDNIMLLNGGGLKLLDFGTARSASPYGEQSLSVVLKPGYAPEEQYRSKGSQGPWTDIYGLCATMYKCITGITPEDSLQRLYEDTVVPPSGLGIAISVNQEAALMMGMACRMENRFQSISALAAALKADSFQPPPAQDTATLLLEEETAPQEPTGVIFQPAPPPSTEPAFHLPSAPVKPAPAEPAPASPRQESEYTESIFQTPPTPPPAPEREPEPAWTLPTASPEPASSPTWKDGEYIEPAQKPSSSFWASSQRSRTTSKPASSPTWKDGEYVEPVAQKPLSSFWASSQSSQTEAESVQTPPEPPRKSSSPLAAILCGGIVLLAAVLFLSQGFGGGKDSSTPSGASANASVPVSAAQPANTIWCGDEVTLTGYIIYNTREYYDQWHSYIDQYQDRDNEIFCYISSFGIRFESPVNLRWPEGSAQIQEAEMGDSDTEKIDLSTEDIEDLVGLTIRMTGRFELRDDDEEITRDGSGYVYHPNGRFDFIIDDCTSLNGDPIPTGGNSSADAPIPEDCVLPDEYDAVVQLRPDHTSVYNRFTCDNSSNLSLNADEIVIECCDEVGIPLGACIRLEQTGFNIDEPITMMVGIDAYGVTGVVILDQNETQGVGTQAMTDSALSRYIGYFNPDTMAESVDAVSGATITSKAITSGVYRAMEIRRGLAPFIGIAHD